MKAEISDIEEILKELKRLKSAIEKLKQSIEDDIISK